jgi:hypothetical protein
MLSAPASPRLRVLMMRKTKTAKADVGFRCGIIGERE